MPATFAQDLCVYRTKNGKPNTSDASDDFSVELGEALFSALGVSPDARGSEPTGDPFSKTVAGGLRAQLENRDCSLVVEPEHPLNHFEQFRLVGALRDMRPEPSRDYAKAWGRTRTLHPATARQPKGPGALRRTRSSRRDRRLERD